MEDVRTGVLFGRYASGSYTNDPIITVYERLDIASRLRQIALAIFRR
jgi:hypothetical protein